MGESAGKGDARGASKAEQELTGGEDDVCAEKKGDGDPPSQPRTRPLASGLLATRHVATRFTSQTGPRCDFTQKIIFSDTIFRRYS